MLLYDTTFWFIAFFLVGICAASVTSHAAIFILTALAIGAFISIRRYWLALLSLGVIVGGNYYFLYDMRARDVAIPFNESSTVVGRVVKVATGIKKQDIVAELESPYRGNILITASRYPAYTYGDVAAFSGTIRAPEDRMKNRLTKDHIFGVQSFPDIELMERGKGSVITQKLLAIKHETESVFMRLLPPKKAAFLAGLVLGETGGFPPEFRDALSVTGTSHLVALSGYNIAIIAQSVMAALGLFLSRRTTIWCGAAAIALFVVMTGAEASTVRAAIMAGIIFLAEYSGRIYGFRNAIAAAAFVMILANPYIVRWDVGFQLSFAAVMGIVYVRPVIAYLLRFSGEPGFLSWRENFLTTVAAQSAVLPILLFHFQSFSPLSIIPNILILAFVPMTMFLGFLMAALAFISEYMALALGWLLSIVLGYELGVIDIFSAFGAVWRIESFGIFPSALYYAALVGGTVYCYRKKSHAIVR